MFLCFFLKKFHFSFIFIIIDRYDHTRPIVLPSGEIGNIPGLPRTMTPACVSPSPQPLLQPSISIPRLCTPQELVASSSKTGVALDLTTPANGVTFPSNVVPSDLTTPANGLVVLDPSLWSRQRRRQVPLSRNAKTFVPGLVVASPALRPSLSYSRAVGNPPGGPATSVIFSDSETPELFSQNDPGRSVAHVLCPYAGGVGACLGTTCGYLHGETCPACQNDCLYPGDLVQNDEHITMCVARLGWYKR